MEELNAEKFIWDILKEWKFERKEEYEGEKYVYRRYYGTFFFEITLIHNDRLIIYCKAHPHHPERILTFKHELSWREITETPLHVLKKNLKFVIHRFVKAFIDADFFGEDITDWTLYS